MQFENKFRKTSAHPLTVSAIFPFLSTYFPGLFRCVRCPSFFTSHHFSLTVSSNPAPGRWCPWKGGPLLNQWLLWSLAISSPGMQSIIPFLSFPLFSLSSAYRSSYRLLFLPPALFLSAHPLPFPIPSVVFSISLILKVPQHFYTGFKVFLTGLTWLWHWTFENCH